jgi:SatD family (SatD)
MAAPIYACLTSDLVDSQRERDRGGVQRRLEELLARVNSEQGERLVVPLAITLGDEWQGLARSVEAAFAVEFAVRRALHPLRVRSGLGVGPVTTELRERTALMDGPCFHRSRAALGVAKKRRGPGTVLASGDAAVDDLVNAMERLMHAVMDDWTQRQFDCVMAFLDHGSESAAAATLGIAQPTLHKSVASARGKELLALVEARNRYLARGAGRRGA